MGHGWTTSTGYVTKAGAPHLDFEMWGTNNAIPLNPGLKRETWGTLISLNSDVGHPPGTDGTFLVFWENVLSIHSAPERMISALL